MESYLGALWQNVFLISPYVRGLWSHIYCSFLSLNYLWDVGSVYFCPRAAIVLHLRNRIVLYGPDTLRINFFSCVVWSGIKVAWWVAWFSWVFFLMFAFIGRRGCDRSLIWACQNHFWKKTTAWTWQGWHLYHVDLVVIIFSWHKFLSLKSSHIEKRPFYVSMST